MIEIIGSVIGALGGGVLRSIPEVLKLWDAGNVRAHEYRLAVLSKDADEARAKLAMAASAQDYGYKVTLADLEALVQGLNAQSRDAAAAAAAGHGWVAAASASVRPVVTYTLLAFYVAWKTAGIVAVWEDGLTIEQFKAMVYSPFDEAMMQGALAFWFVGRVWEKQAHA